MDATTEYQGIGILGFLAVLCWLLYKNRGRLKIDLDFRRRDDDK